MNSNEFDILSLQFRCAEPLSADILREHPINPSARDNIYNTPPVTVYEAASIENAVYKLCRTYDRVIRKAQSVCLYITHRTEKARELVLTNELLQFLAERKIALGVE